MKKYILLLLILCSAFILSACGCEHEYGEVIIKEATCAENGLKTLTCTLCGQSKDEIIPPNGEHNYVNGEIVKEATCVDGEQKLTCTLCGDIKNEVIPAVAEHEFSYKQKILKAPTCVEDGLEEKCCKNCDFKYEKIMPKTGNHKYTSTTTLKATCAKEGIRTKTCTVCNDVVTEVIPKTNKHSYTEKVIKKATCKATGTKELTCSVCQKKETQTIAKTTSHVEVKGRCSVCNIVINAKTELGNFIVSNGLKLSSENTYCIGGSYESYGMVVYIFYNVDSKELTFMLDRQESSSNWYISMDLDYGKNKQYVYMDYIYDGYTHSGRGYIYADKVSKSGATVNNFSFSGRYQGVDSVEQKFKDLMEEAIPAMLALSDDVLRRNGTDITMSMLGFPNLYK